MIQDAHESEDFNATPVLTPKQESHYLQAYLPLVRKVVRATCAAMYLRYGQAGYGANGADGIAECDSSLWSTG